MGILWIRVGLVLVASIISCVPTFVQAQTLEVHEILNGTSKPLSGQSDFQIKKLLKQIIAVRESSPPSSFEQSREICDTAAVSSYTAVRAEFIARESRRAWDADGLFLMARAEAVCGNLAAGRRWLEKILQGKAHDRARRAADWLALMGVWGTTEEKASALAITLRVVDEDMQNAEAEPDVLRAVRRVIAIGYPSKVSPYIKERVQDWNVFYDEWLKLSVLAGASDVVQRDGIGALPGWMLSVARRGEDEATASLPFATRLTVRWLNDGHRAEARMLLNKFIVPVMADFRSVPGKMEMALREASWAAACLGDSQQAELMSERYLQAAGSSDDLPYHIDPEPSGERKTALHRLLATRDVVEILQLLKRPSGDKLREALTKWQQAAENSSLTSADLIEGVADNKISAATWKRIRSDPNGFVAGLDWQKLDEFVSRLPGENEKRPGMYELLSVLDRRISSEKKNTMSDRDYAIVESLLGEIAWQHGQVAASLKHLITAQGHRRLGYAPMTFSEPKRDLGAEIRMFAEEYPQMVVDGRAVDQKLSDAQRGLLAFELLLHGETIVKQQAERESIAFALIRNATMTEMTLENAWATQEASADPKNQETFLEARRRHEFEDDSFQKLLYWETLSPDFLPACPESHIASSEPQLFSAKEAALKPLVRDALTPAQEEKSEALKRFDYTRMARGEKLEDVRQRLKANAALVFIVPTRNETFVFLVKKNVIRFARAKLNRTFVNEQELAARAKQIQAAVVMKKSFDHGTVEARLAAELYDSLFGSLQHELGEIHDLIIVTRGPALAIPFGVLKVPASITTDRAKIRRLWFDDRFSWSIGFGQDSAQQNVFEKKPRGSLVQLGPPDYHQTGGDCFVIPSAVNADEGGPSFCSIQSLASLYLNAEDGTRYSSTILLQGSDAEWTGLAKLSDEKKLDYSTLIVAAHGITPTLSEQLGGIKEAALVFPSKSGRPLIQPDAIKNLRMFGATVILAVCNTAAGGRNSEEPSFSGIVLAFMHAGASEVVATYYEVPESTTGSIIGNFLAPHDGSTAAEALGAARRSIRQHGGLLALPFFWAGLVLVGPY